MNRQGIPRSGSPIDHVVMNSLATNLLTHCRTNQSVTVSDHFPIEFVMSLPIGRFRVVRWPTQVSEVPKKQNVVDLPALPLNCSFSEWQKAWSKWIAKTCDCKVPDKQKVRVTWYKKKAVPVDHEYRRLLKLEGAARHMVKHGETDTRVRSVQRKANALHVQLPKGSSAELLSKVVELRNTYMEARHKRILDEWKGKARQWKTSMKAAFAYIRHNEPQKICTLRKNDTFVACPDTIDDLLNEYWLEKETWPKGLGVEQALINLEEHYATFLPSVQCDPTLLPSHVTIAIKRAKASATGLDAWSIHELKLLPDPAIQTLCHIIEEKPYEIRDSLTCRVKRVPIAKIAEPMEPGDVRPIDLYSAILRVHSSAIYSLLQPWAREVLNPCQYATTGGALSAVSRIALRTELALENMTPTLAISVDLPKCSICYLVRWPFR